MWSGAVMSDAFQLAFACAPAESAKQERKHEAEKHQNHRDRVRKANRV
jgi:hypothetical protein